MKTVLMSADMIPLKMIPVQDAVHRIVMGTHRCVDNHPTRTFRSERLSVAAPLSITANRHVVLPSHFYGPARLTNENLFMRDDHICVYCGTYSQLTRDHVIPTAKGGKNVWKNVVTACSECNQSKGDTLHITNSKGQFEWSVYNPYKGTDIVLVLDSIPKTPTKLALLKAKHTS